ncbi:glutathione transport system substrate-binding protein [Neorhizobium sp. R1-B]|uniref:ABC transporter substrate-binding protein n=1 Tax=unclassified Neorhizobium TaxID=2629175 RepID=UPI000DD9C6AA|nr:MULTISPECIES: ABC transporter substrate-binding protein [unclassified Neorhizobium]TCV65565.1 glutathione transport system substrate-binding protein [Neorhizobium sp. S3-V5DH]TDX77240.1 glutathione transport system substrate-binding protein [Neorhizobium sp. R1-B]
MAMFLKNRRFVLASAVAGALMFPIVAGAATLNVMQTEAPRSMDPGDQTATYTAALLDPMYEGLTKRDPDLSLKPALATEWSSDAAGLVWTFKLRPGVKFHDGTPFDADAVVKNFTRHLDTKRGLAASGRLRTFLEGVTAVDPMTVQFKLKTQYPAFLALLATGPCLMVSPAAETAGTIGSKAVGTGPYKLAEYKSGEYVLQTKNTEWWGGAPKGEDEIKWTWTPEPSVMNMALQTGDADVVNPFPAAFAQQIKANPDMTLSATDGSAVFWVSLNTKMKPLDDVRVRQALNYATDREGIVKAFMQGFATPANSPLAPVTPGYDKSLAPYSYDVEKAKQLLKEAGYPEGFSMSTIVQEQESRIGELLQAMWAKAGVKLEVRKMEGGVWSKAAFLDPAGKEKDTIGSSIASWSSGVNGADLQFRPLYHSKSASPAGANLGFFSDPKLDELIDKAASTLDEKARNAIYVDAQKLVNEQAPHVLLFTKQDLFATRAGVKGTWVIPGGLIIVKDARK